MRRKSLIRSSIAAVIGNIPSAVFASEAGGNDAPVLVTNLQPIANWLCVVLLIALVSVPLLAGAAKREKYLRILWRTWAGMLIWSILCCLLLPLILQRVTGDSTVWRYFPEPAGIIGVAAAGWLSAAILTVIVKSLFDFVYLRRDKLAAAKTSEP